jgi:hypothetical protein
MDSKLYGGLMEMVSMTIMFSFFQKQGKILESESYTFCPSTETFGFNCFSLYWSENSSLFFFLIFFFFTCCNFSKLTNGSGCWTSEKGTVFEDGFVNFIICFMESVLINLKSLLVELSCFCPETSFFF